MTTPPPTQEDVDRLAAEATRLRVDVDVPRAVALGIDLETLGEQIRFAAAHQTTVRCHLSPFHPLSEAAPGPRYEFRSLVNLARAVAAETHGYSPPAGGLVAAARRAARARR